MVQSGLKNTHVFITGAAGGIGLATTEAFLQEEALVTAMYHSSPGELERLAQEYNDLVLVQGDVRTEAEVKHCFERANSIFGRVTVLVANAGIANQKGVGIHNMSIEQWQNTLSVNLTGAFLCAKYFFRNLETFPGRIASLVLVGSTAGIFGEAWYCDYATSKAGMHGLMMSLKNEIVYLAPRGRVNLINPGWTLTPMSKEALSDKELIRRIYQTIPMRKTAMPEDIANAIVFLSSDRLAGHISGQSITIAGGMEGRVLYTTEEISL